MAKKGKSLCNICRNKWHEQCPLVSGCQCCKRTMEQMSVENLDSYEEHIESKESPGQLAD